MIPSMRRPLVMLLAALGIPTVALAQVASAPAAAQDPIAQLVARLDLEQYKATIKGLTQFGDRRQGTDRNRAAVNWIEAQLRSYGCADVARLKYDYQPPPPRPRTEGAGPARDTSRASGGGHYRGVRARTGVNNDSLQQPDARLRALDAQASTPGAREEVYCTKVGSVHPGEMYIVGAHMDGIGWGEAANDDGSGTALVMQFAHGMPRGDGTVSPEQRPEADVNIEFQASAQFAAQAQQLAWTFQAANEKYATDYPASVGAHMTNTDSAPFQDLVAAISLRENERGAQIGAGWDPNWHQPTDLYSTYSDKDFRLGLNAAQTTLAALTGLVGTTIK